MEDLQHPLEREPVTDGLGKALARFEAAPDLESRIAAQHLRFDEATRKYTEMWRNSAGSYSQMPGDLDELESFEKLISWRVEDVLRGDSNPGVVVDFGGMYSLSMVKVAKHFEEAVRAGRLVFVSTSWSFNPKEDRDRKLEYVFPDETAYFEAYHPQAVKEYLKRNMELVNYVNCNAFSFADVEVDSPQGKVKMADGIDFLHEVYSISMHSKLLDLELPSLGVLLRERGVMMLENFLERTPVRKKADENLAKLGITMDGKPGGTYNFYSRKS